jgi:hypothetical protein
VADGGRILPTVILLLLSKTSTGLSRLCECAEVFQKMIAPASDQVATVDGCYGIARMRFAVSPASPTNPDAELIPTKVQRTPEIVAAQWRRLVPT